MARLFARSGSTFESSSNSAPTVHSFTLAGALRLATAALLLALPEWSFGQAVIATLGAGQAPLAVAANPITNKIYVANNGGGTVTVIDGANHGITTVSVGTNPRAVAVNTATNKVYVANGTSNDVTVIDGATNNTASIAVGAGPVAVAVNPVTDKIYVANANSNNVTVINGATNTTMTVAAGMSPSAVAVNPVTNSIYVANSNGASVTVIDGATNSTSTVAVGLSPLAVAVNLVTNKIYVANSNSNNVTVIDGVTGSTTTVPVGAFPVALAVNPVNNKIYVADQNDTSVDVIDGNTNLATPITALLTPRAVAVNPLTNRVYVTTNSNRMFVIDGATDSLAAGLQVGSGAIAVAVDPVTNRIYVPNQNSNDVTVIDGATYDTTVIAVAGEPSGVAANPVTNKIYVTNASSNSVTVIDGTTNTTTTIAAGTRPAQIAINQVTNQIYVGNIVSQDMTVIDGATNTTSTVAVGAFNLALNPVTNKIYSFSGSSTVVVDGATNAATTVSTSQVGPAGAIAVNPVNNKVYVTDQGTNTNPGSVTAIDGASNNTVIIPVGGRPDPVCVNPNTNKIYVGTLGGALTIVDGASNVATPLTTIGSFTFALGVNVATNKVYAVTLNSLPGSSATLFAIDGATGNTTAMQRSGSLLQCEEDPGCMAINPITNKIYLPQNDGTSLVLDGITNSTRTVPVGVVATNVIDTDALDVALNPVTNKIYVTNPLSNTVTVIDEAPVQPVPLQTVITPLPGNETTPGPVFNFSASSTFSPTATSVGHVYFQLDTWQGPWLEASGSTPNFSGSFPAPLLLGNHVIYAFATDGQDANSTGIAQNLIGPIAGLAFTVIPPSPTSITLRARPRAPRVGHPVGLFVNVTSSSLGIPTGTVSFRERGANLGTAAVSANGRATLTTSALARGNHSIIAIYSGDNNLAGSSSRPVTVIVRP